MPHIDEVAFAKLVTGGKVYRSAVLVFPDHANGRWWRKDGMAYSPEDFAEVVGARPDVVVLGTGFMSKVRVEEETRSLFEENGIECIVSDSAEAVEQFNSLLGKKKVIGAFHLL